MTTRELRHHFQKLARGARHRAKVSKRYDIQQRNAGIEKAYRNAAELTRLLDKRV